MGIRGIDKIQAKIKKILDEQKSVTVPSEIHSITDRFKQELLDSMNRGVSPVEGQGRWQDYSDSYKNQIGGRFKSSSGRIVKKEFGSKFAKFGKTVRPVNLKLSGGLQRSLRVLNTVKGFRVEFNSPLADIHDRLGAGRKRVKRRLLPRGNERFSRALMNMITGAARAYLKRISKLWLEVLNEHKRTKWSKCNDYDD